MTKTEIELELSKNRADDFKNLFELCVKNGWSFFLHYSEVSDEFSVEVQEYGVGAGFSKHVMYYEGIEKYLKEQISDDIDKSRHEET